MAVKNTKNRKTVSKKHRQKRPPKNRYMRGAQMSEYRFLKILRAFADDVPAFEAKAVTGFAAATNRRRFSQLRQSLVLAALRQPMDFGGAGYFLFDKSGYSQRGKL